MVNQYVPVGRILKTHGLKGDLKVWPYFHSKAFYLDLKEVRIVTGENTETDFQVLKAVAQNDCIIYHLSGIDTIDDGTMLKGLEVLIAADRLEKLPSHDYYWHDLEGLTVYSKDGAKIGQVVDFIDTRSNQVLSIIGEKGEVLIPAIRDVITEVDLERKRIIINPVEGLLD